MKQMIAAVMAVLFAVAPVAQAESIQDGSDMNTTGRQEPVAEPGAPRPPAADMATRRADILPIARDVKPGALPLSMIDAIIMRESRYRADARGARGEVGLMQILPATARNIAREHGMARIADMSGPDLVRYLSEPRNNLRIGLAYLYWCYNRADRNIGATVGCYNAGPANMWRWESISVTRSYVRHVREHMARNGFAGS